MAMHQSSELNDVAFVLFEQLRKLGGQLWGTGFAFCEEQSDVDQFWFANEKGILPPAEMNHHEDDVHLSMYEGWKNNLEYFEASKGGAELEAHYNHMMSLPKVRPFFQQMLNAGLSFPKWQQWNAVYFSRGYLLIISLEPYSEPQTLVRFAKVFDQAYTRFLDLQKAEAQAREAQVELALERIRSNVTIMKESADLFDIVVSMRSEFVSLGCEADYFWHMRWLSDRYDMSMTSEDGNRVGMMISIPKFVHEGIPDLIKWEKSNEPVYVLALDAEKAWDYIDNMNTYGRYEMADPNAPTKEDIEHIGGLTFIIARTTHGEIGYSLPGVVPHPPKDAMDILMRFAGVFDLAYRRFEDLKKAEQQARENQIELALERTRTHSMLMQHSDEIKDISKVFHQQLMELNIPTEFSYVWLPDESKNKHQFWASWIEEENDEKVYKSKQVTYPLDKTEAYTAACYEAWAKPDIVHVEFIPPKDISGFFNAWAELLEGSKNLKAQNFKKGIYYSEAYMKYGCFGINIRRELSKEEKQILKRFSIEFERTYTRFLDLRKAEKQARESEIELALERVRARSMAMRKSEELADLSLELVKQVQNLGVDTWFCAFNIYDDSPEGSLEWGSNGQGTFPKYRTPRENVFLQYYEAGQKGEKLHINEINENECPAHYEYLCSLPGVGEQLLKIKDVGISFPSSQIDHVAFFSFGYILFITFEAVPEAHDIFIRFAKVFEQTYTRFLDLQKSEKQAREAQIEAALEKIRTRTMAMQHSDELPEAANDLFKEVKALGINAWSCGYNILEEDQKSVSCVMSSEDIIQTPFHLPLSGERSFLEWLKAYENGQDFFKQELGGKEIKEHYEYLMSLPGIEKATEGLDKAGIPFPKYQVNHLSFFSQGFLLFITYEEVPDAHQIFKRFTAVFEQTYTRFLDLKRAEAQARESQIEVALERVRARAMAMHNSEELSAVASVLFEQMRILGGDLFAFGIVLCDKYENEVEQWHSIGEEGMMMPFRIPIDLDYIHQYRYNKWKSGESLFSVEIPENYIQRHFELMFEVPSFKASMDDVAERGVNITTPDWEIDYGASFSHGYLLVSSLSPFKEEYIFPRFAKVFEQAYTRFLDLKKAEEQAKEAQVELALERVRAKVTAMSESTDLLDIVVTMRTEFVSLGHQAGYFWYMRWLPEKYEKAMTSGDGTKIGMVMSLPRHIHGDIPLVADWEKSDEPTVVLAMDVETAVDYVDKMINLGDFEQVDPNAPTLDDIRHIGGLTFVMARTTHGEIGFSLNGTVPYPPQKDLDTLVRFAAVFDLAYSRFEDLKNAEARTKETLKQATLDRVRAQVASMRNTDDLQQITPLIWQELKTLEVPFSRCGVFIVDDKQKHVNVYLSTPDGKALAALDLKFEANELTKNTLEHWRQNKVYHQHWNQEEFIAWTQEMMKLRQIKTAKDYTGGDAPPKSLHLYFIPFTQGMLYVGHSEALNESFVDLIKSLAESFSFAYARYEDFIVLEDAKVKVEKTLMDLKATQSQLIHAEKMASLGELTAGIAHEIQNPLNFVNNFSEVSTDLIVEMNEELKNGDLEEVKAIADDLLQNLEKINNHGKRASSIVKGMLEHSRSGSGEKIPTDINILADEYLRLAYHGLRAKNKSFNADFKMMADKELPLLNIVPQDIGRVLLNLINNAFYAVDEKVKQNTEAYKPQVVVSTAQSGDGVEIRVKDNGNGIPDKVKEKIFQPFFTTKPTGQGTGLGLSMSYDIITKGHGGNIEVFTKPGKSTEFIIQLPK